MAKNDNTLKPLDIKNPDQEIIENIEGTVSSVFPDTELVKEEDLKVIDEENAAKTLKINEELNKEEEHTQVAWVPKIKFPKKPKPKDDDTITGLQEKQEEILKTKADEGQLYTKDGNQYVFNELDDKQLEALEKTILDLTGEGGAATKIDTAKLLKNKTFNVNDFGNTVYKAFKNEIDKFKNGPTTVEEVLQMASKYGLNEVYTHILKAPKGKVLPKEIIAAGLIQTRVLGLHLDTLMRKIAQGTASEADMIATQQTFKLYAALMGKVNAAMSEWGTTGAIFRHIDLSKVQMGDLDIMMSKLGADMTPGEWKSFASHFLQLDLHQKTVFVKETWGKKLSDVWAEVWVNTRLMSPITHTVNVVGNLSFNSLRVLEYGIAAGINKVPGLSAKDGVMFSEVWSMITSLNKGTKLALGNGYKVIKTGDPITSKTTKMDLKKNKSLTAENLLPDKYKDSWLGMGFDFLGSAFRIPGRFLLAEDEAMKGIIFHMELDRLATKKFNIAIADGVPKEDAIKLYKATLANPDQAVVREIKEQMLEGTFQKKLPPGVFADLQKHMNIPAVKMFVPFYKTIMNIMFEATSRVPLLNLMQPSMVRALKGLDGPAARQLALAKWVTGGSLMLTFGSMAYGSGMTNQQTMITGMAPLGKKEREAFLRLGLQPYSIAVLQSDGTYKSTSYARFDPISSLLAISADMAYFMSRPDHFHDKGFMERSIEVMGAGVAAIVPYLSQQPFAQGLADLGAIFTFNSNVDQPGLSTRAVSMLIEKMTEASVGIAINPTGTFGNYLQKHSDTNIYSTMITNAQAENGVWFGWGSRENNAHDIPTWVKAFYKAINKSKLQSPFFNPNLEKRLNLWGEELVGPEMNYLSPIRIRDGKYNLVDEWLVTFNLGLSMPRASIDGIDLTAEEYNEYIRYINQEDEKTGITMLDQMANAVQSDAFLELDGRWGDQLNILQTILRVRKIAAKGMFLANNPEFHTATLNLKEKIATTGKK